MNLQDLRLKRGIEQRDLACAIGISERTLQRWEAGKEPKATLKQFYDLAIALGIDIWDLKEAIGRSVSAKS